jgi:carboxypeptidase Q
MISLRTLLPSTVLVLGATIAAQASPKDAARILEAAAKPQVTEHLDYLVNTIGPRLTSSDKLTTACEWARDKFKSFGLDARIEKWGTYAVGFNRGKWSGRMTQPEEMALEFKTNSWTPGTKGKVAGPLLSMPADEDEAEELGEKAKGAWFLVSSGGGRRSFFGGVRLNRNVTRVLQANGAHGFVTRDRELMITSGRAPRKMSQVAKLPTINMLPAHHRKLAALLDDGKSVQVEFDIDNRFKKGPVPLYNVIAELKGSKFPEEYVIVGGHIDSWDGATGTTDNGTGVATTIEAARLIMAAGVKPLRTIRFMLWSGEEQGLLGSKAFIRQHTDENAKVSAVLVHDGGTNYVAGISAIESMIPQLEKAFGPVLAAQLELPFKVRKIRRFRPIGSDHDSYLGVGVPGFFWNQAGKANYRRTHHTQHDTFDSAIEEYQIHSSKVIALGAVGIANLEQMLSREGMRADRRRMRVPGAQASGSRRILGVTSDEKFEITSIVDGSVAEKAGLKLGDKFLQIGKTKITDAQQISAALQKGKPKMKLIVERKGEKITIETTFKK